MEAAGPEGCWLVDCIVYVPPLGVLGRWLGGRLVRSRLERMFSYRHEVTRAAFAGWRAARWIVAAGVL
jgi:ligand-binding SRPBCC domain-containing protein